MVVLLLLLPLLVSREEAVVVYHEAEAMDSMVEVAVMAEESLMSTLAFSISIQV